MLAYLTASYLITPYPGCIRSHNSPSPAFEDDTTRPFLFKSGHPIPRQDSISLYITPVSLVAGGDDTTRKTTTPYLREDSICVGTICIRIIDFNELWQQNEAEITKSL
jgi:hypothetical protein